MQDRISCSLGFDALGFDLPIISLSLHSPPIVSEWSFEEQQLQSGLTTSRSFPGVFSSTQNRTGPSNLNPSQTWVGPPGVSSSGLRRVGHRRRVSGVRHYQR